jgi:antitoxin component YwqK of YwqJK toxin-antitoxin module
MKNILTYFFLSTFAIAFGAEKIQVRPPSAGISVLNPDKRFDRKNRKHGEWEFYHDGNTARLASKGTFRHGYQVKTWTYYDTLGNLQKIERKLFLRPRIETTIYHANGKVKKTGYARVKKTRKYLDYYWVGKWKSYDENGNYLLTEVYKKGVPKGEEAQQVEFREK